MMLTSVQLAIEALRTFRWDRPELSLAEIARQVNRPKSTIAKVLTTLTTASFLEPVNGTCRYRPALPMLLLGPVMVNHSQLVQCALPIVEHLAQRTQQTVHLTVCESGEVVWLIRKDCGARYTLYSRVGRRGSAAGRAILAFMEGDSWKTAYARSWSRLTTKTRQDPARLSEEMAEIRRRGYAIQADEVDLGIASIAVPVFDACDRPVASLSVVGPKTMFNHQHIPRFSRWAQAAASLLRRRLTEAPEYDGGAPIKVQRVWRPSPSIAVNAPPILKTALKALSVLTLFSRESPSLSFSEIRAQLSLPKSVASRILATLQHLNILHRDRTNGRFHLSASLLELGLIVEDHHPALQEAKHLVLRLQTTKAATATVFAVYGDEGICLASSDGFNSYREGQRLSLPAHLTTTPQRIGEKSWAMQGPTLSCNHQSVVIMTEVSLLAYGKGHPVASAYHPRATAR